MKRFGTVALAGIALVVASLGGASAQERVDAHKDWSVFVAGTGASKVCWIVSKPTRSSYTRGGKAVQVQRGEVFLLAAMRPADGVKNEVSFLAGYPFAPDAKVRVTVKGKTYTMFTDGENAWTSNAQEDQALTAAFKAGITAELRGESKRGTTTRDTFSLRGFTAALDSAADRCK